MVLNFIPQVFMIAHVVIAMLLAALIGLERELSDKPAGLRTHMLVGGAAAFIVLLSDTLIDRITVSPELLRSDPIRIVEAVITGVSFLGAGTIFRRSGDDHIEGLTTAASLLFVAVTGICVAAGQIGTAIVLTLFALLVLHSGRWLERTLLSRRAGRRNRPQP
ncbi:MAG: hypothetical protein DCC55_00905 [Chloroflexi bacterium]|nr:MAG: hypothetical protein DCC55_00905 [Chloroflexota bacterium]